jgi:dTDP-4-dehydrorhamnose reductase
VAPHATEGLVGKVVVTGAAGMLGTAVIDRLAGRHEVIATDLAAGYRRKGVRWSLFDLCDRDALKRFLFAERPDLVVHTAALVDVERCEQDPSAAERLHVDTTDVISRTLAGWNGSLIYISTDSVFDGRKDGPYDEGDHPAPPNTYARTKLRGEAACLTLERSTVLRTNIFGWSRAERMSFAEWVLRGLVERSALSMFSDVQYTPIHVTQLAEIIESVWQQGVHGLYHAAGLTCLSKYEFAILVASVFRLSTDNVTARSVDDAGLTANRPKNMALCSARLSSALGRAVPPAIDGIQLMRRQYDEGWVARVKGRAVVPGYRFWEVA